MLSSAQRKRIGITESLRIISIGSWESTALVGPGQHWTTFSITVSLTREPPVSFHVVTGSPDPRTGASTAASAPCSTASGPGGPVSGLAARQEEADSRWKRSGLWGKAVRREVGHHILMLGSAEQGWWCRHCTRAQGRQVPLQGCGGLPGWG